MNRQPAEVFPPGFFLREEMAARGWDKQETSMRLGWTVRGLNGVLEGGYTVTPAIADHIAEAFGTSADYWLNLQATWDGRQEAT